MIYFLFIIIVFISYSSATNNRFLGYDFGQQYFRVRLYEYEDYTDVKFLKFNIYGPTNLANWSMVMETDGNCNNYLANIHFDLQYGAYPLVAPLNETFPDGYITKRHDLVKTVFNQTIKNGIVQMRNPLQGTWFVMIFVERLSANKKSKLSRSNCDTYITTWLDYEVVPVSLTLNLNQSSRISLSSNTTFVYASFYTTPDNSRINVLSEWFSNCDIIILARIHGLPNIFQYDYKTICKNSTCSIEIEQLAGFIWIYFQISVVNISCLINPIYGHLSVESTDKNLIETYPTRRIMLNYYYDFLYIPLYKNDTNHSIIFYENQSSIYSYEFFVDEKNIGGTIHLDFRTEIQSFVSLNRNFSILGCLSKNEIRQYKKCENDFKINIEKNSFVVKSLPYPEMGLWYLTLEYNCNSQCFNNSMLLTFQIISTQCTREQCGTYGVCRIMTSQQNIFSTCTCFAGYRGYGCTDGSQSFLSRYLPSVLFLTLSNLMFIPAICLAIYYRLYIEALVYFFNMFFSTFYHACDQEIYRFCIFKYDGLQLSDFIGSYASFVITLITMSLISRSIKIFLFMLGLLACVVINSRDRFDNLQFIALISITFAFTIVTWVTVSIKQRRLKPSFKRLLFIIPGVLFAITGLILFVVVETDDNYWYIHSLWHIFMGTSILFFLPPKIGQQKRQVKSTESSSNTSNSSIGVINEAATISNDEIENPFRTN